MKYCGLFIFFHFTLVACSYGRNDAGMPRKPDNKQIPDELAPFEFNGNEQSSDFYNHCIEFGADDLLVKSVTRYLSGFQQENCGQIANKLANTDQLSLVFPQDENLNQPSLDLTMFSKLDKLKEIQIINADLEFLPSLPQLTSLDLIRSKLVDPAQLTGSPLLKSLRLEQVPSFDLSVFSQMQHLVALEIREGKNYKFSSLRSLKNLEYLSVNHSNLIEIDFFESLINLRELNISYNKINSLNSLKTLVSLNKLYLDENDITDLSPLGNLESLSVITAPKTVIKDVDHCPVELVKSNVLMIYCHNYLSEE